MSWSPDVRRHARDLYVHQIDALVGELRRGGDVAVSSSHQGAGLTHTRRYTSSVIITWQG